MAGTVRLVGNNINELNQLPPVATTSGVLELRSGADHALALMSGTRGVVGWGDSSEQQLAIPTEVAVGPVQALAVGSYHSLALMQSTGEVKCWGQAPNNGCNGLPVELNANIQAVRATQQGSFAKLANGSWFAWGMMRQPLLDTIPLSPGLLPARLNGLTDIVEDESGDVGVLALFEDGTVWHSNSAADVEPVLQASTNGAAICAGRAFALILDTTGTVTLLGNEPRLECPLEYVGKISAVACGYDHVTARLKDGSVVAWGVDNKGETEVPAQLAGAGAGKPTDSVTAGRAHSLALAGTDPGVVQFGWLPRRSLDAVPASVAAAKIQAISVGLSCAIVLAADGSVQAWGDSNPSVADIPASVAAGKVVAVAAGADHVLALMSTGEVEQWGNVKSTAVPAAAKGPGVTAIAADWGYSLALVNGGVVAWSYGTGDSDACNLAQVPAKATSDVVSISAGQYQAIALKRDGTVEVWGCDAGGVLAIPSEVSSGAVIAAAAGTSFALALLDNGKVVSWGSGPAVPQAAQSGVVSIAAASHALALRSDGTVAAWGSNLYGQVNLGAHTSQGVYALAAADGMSLFITNAAMTPTGPAQPGTSAPVDPETPVSSPATPASPSPSPSSPDTTPAPTKTPDSGMLSFQECRWFVCGGLGAVWRHRLILCAVFQSTHRPPHRCTNCRQRHWGASWHRAKGHAGH
jgi:alpha-tubulin suppressor-like RCC1 family protein